jgi:predicted  nucleic acid-binding Zn-ribbon protein
VGRIQPNDATKAELLRESIERQRTSATEENRALADKIQNLDQMLAKRDELIAQMNAVVDWH